MRFTFLFPNFYLPCILISGLCTSCAPPSLVQTPVAAPVPLPSQTSTAPIKPSPLIPPTNTKFPSLDTDTQVDPTIPPDSQDTEYWATALLSPSKKKLTVEEIIGYTNTTGSAITKIPLLLPADKLHLHAFYNQNLKTVSKFEYDWANQIIWFHLKEPLAPGVKLRMYVEFAIYLPDSPAPLSATVDLISLSDWLYTIPPYVPDRGWLINPPHEIGETRVDDKAYYHIDISLDDPDPDSWIVLASHPGDQEGDHYFYDTSLSRNFTWVAGSKSKYIWLYQSDGGVTVQALVQQDHQAAGLNMLSIMQSAIQIYSEILGIYQNSNLTAIETSFPDGLERDGLFYLNQDYFTNTEDFPADYLTILSAHETAHQWWYAAVGSDAANEPWLDEALSTYSELLFYEAEYPFLAQWWWDFRVKRFEPRGKINTTVYDYREFRPYVNAVYLRGVLFLDAIRNNNGNEAFLAGLYAYAQSGSGQIAQSSDFYTYFSPVTEQLRSDFLK